MQGWRVAQQVFSITFFPNSIPDVFDKWAMFAVYDAHGGSEVATFDSIGSFESVQIRLRKVPQRAQKPARDLAERQQTKQ